MDNSTASMDSSKRIFQKRLSNELPSIEQTVERMSFSLNEGFLDISNRVGDIAYQMRFSFEPATAKPFPGAMYPIIKPLLFMISASNLSNNVEYAFGDECQICMKEDIGSVKLKKIENAWGTQQTIQDMILELERVLPHMVPINN